MTGPVLVVGLGGLGCPVLEVLAESGVRDFTLLDDDVVSLSNLHRQTLYSERDVGEKKAFVARAALEAQGANVRVLDDRLLPENALDVMREHALVVEGADNLPTKFLAVDAARLSGVPLVSGGAVRFSGWAMATLPSRNAPCMRCVFEDIPNDRVETCAEAGVLGPVVGVVGAAMASLALRVLAHDALVAGELVSYDALRGTLRTTRIERRADCALCTGAVNDLSRERYAASCAL